MGEMIARERHEWYLSRDRTVCRHCGMEDRPGADDMPCVYEAQAIMTTTTKADLYLEYFRTRFGNEPAVQELIAEVERLRAENAELQERLNAMKGWEPPVTKEDLWARIDELDRKAARR